MPITSIFPFPLLHNILTSLHTSLTTRLNRFLLSVLAYGPIPRHIGFVMDGNRRYARSLGMRVEEGHGAGFESLKGILEICLRLQIKCVSIFAFSIENFARPQNEVDEIMYLAKTNLRRLCEEGELLDQYDVRVNILGQRHLLPLDVQEAVSEIESLTAGHSSAILNVCCPYTSRDEITTAMRSTVASVRSGLLSPMNVTGKTVEAELFTSKVDSPPLDILIRTSDVRRLSDYLMWQCSSTTSLQFVKTFWPKFGIRDMLPILLAYQRKVFMQRVA